MCVFMTQRRCYMRISMTWTMISLFMRLNAYRTMFLGMVWKLCHQWQSYIPLKIFPTKEYHSQTMKSMKLPHTAISHLKRLLHRTKTTVNEPQIDPVLVIVLFLTMVHGIHSKLVLNCSMTCPCSISATWDHPSSICSIRKIKISIEESLLITRKFYSGDPCVDPF